MIILKRRHRQDHICARILEGNQVPLHPSSVGFLVTWPSMYPVASHRGCETVDFRGFWRLEPCQRFVAIDRSPTTNFNDRFMINYVTCFLRQASRCSPSETRTRTLYWFSESWAWLSSWKSIIAVVACRRSRLFMIIRESNLVSIRRCIHLSPVNELISQILWRSHLWIASHRPPFLLDDFVVGSILCKECLTSCKSQ